LIPFKKFIALLAVMGSALVVPLNARPNRPKPVNLADLNIFTIVPAHNYAQPFDCPLTAKRPVYSLGKITQRIRRKKTPDQVALQITDPNGSFKQRVNVFKGVKKIPCERIFIYSRGFIPLPLLRPQASPRHGGGVYWVYSMIQQDLLAQATWITFDYLDNIIQSDMGQSFDLSCLKSVIDAVQAKNPHAQITLVGLCRGAHAILRYLATTPVTNVDSIILESPYIQGSDMVNSIADNYMASYLGDTNAHSFFKKAFSWYYPGFKPAQDNLLELVSGIKNKKIFIGHGLPDSIVTLTTINTLAEQLKHTNDVHLFIMKDSPGHGSLTFAQPFRQAVNAFCAQCSFPHDQQLALAGMQDLMQAHRAPVLA
jgi:hypothetical protein